MRSYYPYSRGCAYDEGYHLLSDPTLRNFHQGPGRCSQKLFCRDEQRNITRSIGPYLPFQADTSTEVVNGENLDTDRARSTWGLRHCPWETSSFRTIPRFSCNIRQSLESEQEDDKYKQLTSWYRFCCSTSICAQYCEVLFLKTKSFRETNTRYVQGYY